MGVVGVRVVACGATLLALVLSRGEPRAFVVEREPEYHIHALRDLDGSDARGNSINEWGMVAGYSNQQGDPTRRAMVWLFGHPVELRALGGPESNVTWPGQSSTGLVAGIAQTNKPQIRSDGWSCRGFFTGPDARTYTCEGFVWEWGKIHRLRGLGGDNSFAVSGNNRRQVVGWAETREPDPSCVEPTDRGFHAVRWDLNENRVVELPPYGADSASAATAINDRGQTVGISGKCDQSIGRHSARHAVLWHDRAVTLLRSDATSWNTPAGITQRGDIVVGFANSRDADPGSPALRAVLWTTREDVCPKLPGTDMCELGTLDGDATSQALGVNDRGQVVGSSCLGSFCRAFLWEKGTMKDLNDVKGHFTDHLENAMDINNSGQISGRFRTAADEFGAFVASPRSRD